jgi:tRNA-dihydrouridine synthase
VSDIQDQYKPYKPHLGFWKKVKEQAFLEKRPIYVLAPMADVTDCAFRKMINIYGKPDVTWTEFVSADGLIRATSEGKAKLVRDLKFDSKIERPIVAQLFSSHPEYMRQAAALVQELGFDGIDINMGCPDRSIEKQGCGAAMMKTPKIAQEIIKAAKEGAPNLPITVKTRIGYNKNELETWLPALLEAEPAVITIHARTRKEMSKVPARWEHVARAVEIRDVFFDTQDVRSLEYRTMARLQSEKNQWLYLSRAHWLQQHKVRMQSINPPIKVNAVAGLW